MVNHFMRRAFIVSALSLTLAFLSPFYSYWTSPFHHATWRAMLPAVSATYKQTSLLWLLMLFILALSYWMYIVNCNLSGIKLNQQNSTARAGGRTRPLGYLESVESIKRQPDILGRRYTVQLQWDDNFVLIWWQKVLFSIGPKTSFVGVFRQEASADRVAAAMAEFATVPVQHRTH